MISNRIKELAALKNIKTAREFSIALSEQGLKISHSNAARYFKSSPPSFSLKFIEIASKVLECHPGELFEDMKLSTNSSTDEALVNKKRSEKSGPRSELF
ncbi:MULTISPECIES: helix-turn-helix domain-containing protein [Deefgea]|uniref:Helix-turn-helix domain-containing protein n=1 Tax=Deefgea chitinilytica TaxID=570276 RepID=A0ABS2CDA6_9NEIS|nr:MULTISPECIES: helix-turn-helix domain-containing protein [Deefgea]MBM5572105.1 helix-turn-helix domain-containing protein [Deefgea chitinilytica]MBM9889340.1 helix-turn-helix domain-containing protein [Deefgea sp. CFH1-16]